jgi:type II secretory pathway component PulF
LRQQTLARYKYIAVDQTGQRITDVLEAVDRSHVLERLQQQGHLAIDVSEIGEGDPVGTGAGGTVSQSGNGQRRNRRISEAEVTLFTREMAMLLDAGLTLAQSLKMLEVQATSPKSREVISELSHALADGKSFEQALAATGNFAPLYINMIRVAEATGTVKQVLSRLAEDREREAKLRSSALSAMLYPGFLIVTAIAAVVIILMVVVPRFKDVIADNSTALPASAQFVFDASDWLIAYGHWLAAAIAGVVFIAWSLSRIAAVRAWFELIALRLPVIGGLVRMGLTVRFTRTLATLLGNGVGLPDALDLTRSVIGNSRVASVITSMGTELRKGQDFIEPLQNSRLFAPLVINMLKVGDETGNLGSASGHIANMYQDKLETSIARLFTIMEPIIILLVSALIAGIVISIMGAVFSVNDLALG